MIEEGIKEGAKALIDSLKKVLPDVDSVYHAVTENELYHDLTKEQVLQYYQKE